MPSSTVRSQGLVINEVMSSNGEAIFDEDGRSPDWIEIVNTSGSEVDLDGYGLSDSADPFQWVLPSIAVAPGNHLLVFASGKDRRDAPPHWETVIDQGDEWRYIVPDSEPAAAWKRPGFTDLAWAVGRTGIGYGDGDDRTEVPAGTISVYARKTFRIDDPGKITDVFLDIDFDDAFAAYLNGVEIARENLEDLGRPPAYNDTAITYTEPKLVFGGRPFHYALTDFPSILRAGENVLAIQLYNTGPGSSDLTLIPFLTLGMEYVPEGARGPADILRSNLPALHTNFKIDSDGETITLASPEGVIVDSVDTGLLPADVSLGRFPDGTGEFAVYVESTPGRPNSAPGYPGICGEPLFSHDGGFYPGAVTLTLATDEAGGAIHFTLDGTDPTEGSPSYQSPITIHSTTVLRAKVLKPGWLAGRTATHTYFINETPTLPVVSISTAPENFFDQDIGIYVLGDDYQDKFPYFGANFWEDWERPVHVELFEPDGSLGFSVDAGAKIFGGWSRGNAQRSLAIFARRKYGASEIRYRIFPQKKIKKFESFVLRNSGNDWQNTHFRDGLMTSLLDDVPVDRQAYRPSVLYINGEYWGILNLREKVNEHFVESNHEGVQSDQIDLLEANARAIHGDAEHYNSLIALVRDNDVNDPAVYSQIDRMMDIDNFIDYEASEIYFDNEDWPGNNIKFWRPRVEGGRWHWILYDTDFGFGIWNANKYVNNTLAFALEPNGPGWPNPPWSTLLFRRLVTSEKFVHRFVNRFATHLDTIFKAQKVLDRIGEMEAALAPEMPAQRQRWGGSVSNWRSNVDVMKNFARNRVGYVRSHMTSVLHLSGAAFLKLDVSPPGGGTVEVQGIEIMTYPWGGTYFQDIPIAVRANPRPGFRFVGWEGITPEDQAAASVVLSGGSREVKASFRLDCDASSLVVINEINYNAPDDRDPGDWVELHNPTVEAVDIGGWTFRDASDTHVFAFPAGTTLAGGGYLVLCSDKETFLTFFPAVENALGDVGFSLAGGGEPVRIVDPTGGEVDSVSYEDESPWPAAADGGGAVLALKNPFLDNAYPLFWAASPSGGTPGEKNDVFEDVETDCSSARVRFLRGDATGDGRVDISDSVGILDFLFLAKGRITCLDAGDANDDGVVDISDAMAILLYLFNGTVDIPLPGGDTCGVDPTGDSLNCKVPSPCGP